MVPFAFEKYQATLNDFLVVEASRVPELDGSQLARTLCARRAGVGADGLLLLSRGVGGWSVAVHNADGSLAETSGNGLRCAFCYLLDHDLLEPGPGLALQSGAGRVVARTSGQKIAVNMGPPRFDGDNLPDRKGRVSRVRLALGRRILCGLAVSMGNPHLVVEIDPEEELESFPLQAVHDAALRSDAFPEGVNVEAIRRISPARIEARVWERGVGETRSCGSGACATVAALSMFGRVESPTSVIMPGGTLRVEWGGEPPADLWLSGPAIRVFTGSCEEPVPGRTRG